jgi:ribulose-5-phosphate 4-epimerase/fuculose-1-phosphate aldolase
MALNMLEDNRLIPACQTSAFFDGHIAYDDDYLGLADTLAEGERLASVLGDKPVLFMRNHGVLVATDTVAQASHLLYMLERACRAQIRAMSSGRELLAIDAEVIERVQAPDENDRHRGKRQDLFFDAMKRILDREMPGYAD